MSLIDEISMSNEVAARFLYRASFGPKQGEVDALVTTGLAQWFETQFSAPVSEHLSTSQRFAEATGEGYLENARLGAFWFHAVQGEDQLRQRMTFALSEIFVVSHTGVFRPLERARYYDLLAEHAFGNFRDLLKAVTLSAAMGQFLTLNGSSKANPNNKTFPDENYAREVMQLFTIGL